MSITDELRTGGIYRPASNRRYFIEEELTAIADRIDAEHERLMRERRGCIHYDQERHYCNVHGDTESGWVRLPLDADGVPIHVGDVVTDGKYTFVVYELAVFGDGSWSIRNEDGNAWAACDVTHHHEPTVEDVLREFTDEVWNRCCEGATASDSGIDGLVAECAARLRLAGDGE